MKKRNKLIAEMIKGSVNFKIRLFLFRNLLLLGFNLQHKTIPF